MKLKYFFIALVAMVACFSEAFAQQVITVSNAEELKQALEEAGAAPQARQAAQGSRVTLPVLSIELTEDYDDASELSINSYLELASEVKLLLNGHVVNGDVTLAAGNLSIVDATGTGAWIGCITVNSGATLAAGSGSIIAGESGVAVINNGTLSTDGGAVIGKITNNGSMPGVATYNTALVAKATVAQAALNAAIDGQAIQFASDIEGDLTAVQKPNTNITIDGAKKTLKGTIIVDGKSYAYATAGVTIKNLNFDATGISKEASINLGDGANATRYTSNVTIDACSFKNGGDTKAAVKSYQGGCKNLVITNCTAEGMHSLLQAANITGITITGCTATTKNGINLNSSSNVKIENNTITVKGYAVRAGVSGGTSGKIELTNNTLTTDNTEGDPVIVLRGTASDQVDLKMSENSVSGNVHISGTTANTKISAEANYWDGKEQPVVAEGSTSVVVNSYYKDAERTTLERNEMGSVNAFVSADRISGDVTHNAISSLVIQILDANNNVIGTSTLTNDKYIDSTKHALTWRINLGADDSDSWEMKWENGAPSIDNMPAKVKVLVDDVAVGENTVKFTQNGDGKNPVFAAKTDADGKILSYIVSEGFDFSKAAATLVSAAVEGDNIAILKEGTYTVPTGKNLTITGKVAGVKFDMSKAVGVHSSMTFNDVTFEYSTNQNYIGLQHAGTMVYNNCTINGQVFLYGASETFNNCTFKQDSSDAYNVWTYGAKEVAFNDCTFNSKGKSVLIYAESASIFNNVTVSRCTFNASTAVAGKAAIEMDSSLTGGINLTIDAATTATGFGTGNVSGNSLWNNKKGNANNANNDITVTVDGTTVLEPIYVAKIGETGHRTLQEALAAVQAGETITLLADVTTSDITNINKAITLDGNGKKLTTTATRGFQITGGTVTINDLTIDMPNAAEGNRGINLYNGDSNAALDVTLNNVTINGGKAYAVNIGGGKDNKLTINGSTLTGYAAINVHTSSVNHTIVVDGSTLNGKNHNNNYSFGTVVIDGTNAHSLTITNTTITTENLEGVTSKYEKVVVGPNCTLVWDGEAAVRNILADSKGGKLYYTDLQAAINDAAEVSGTVQILGNITTTKSVVVPANKKVTLDLNGKTINGTDNETKSFGLININPGAELTINGEGAITLAATNNRGWNAYSSVISNQRGKLTVNGGTIEHLGGTDMAYAIDNLTNGKGTYAETIINGGTVKSTYRAIRQFLNGTEAQNILTVNAGTIEGANKSIWMQDANKNANSGSLTVADQAVLKGDVYLFVTAGSTEWPVEVSIADAAFEDGSTVITGNIPAQYIVENANGVWGKSNSVASVNGVGYATFAEAIAAIGNGDVVIELRADATFDYNARDAYGTAETTSVTINGNGNTLTLNQKNSDWASIGLANNSKLVLNNMTIEKTGYGDTSGAWNTHAIIFSCPVEMNDVTVNNSIAVQAGAALTNVTINEANGYYGLWINGNGQTVTVNGGSITATNGGRGIKIADQYIDAPAQVKLSVTGTVFETAQKAAVLVSSKAGANITASDVDITKVAADQVNFVWVDEDWAEYFSEVEVTGATVSVEGADSFAAAITENGAVKGYYKTLAEALTAAADGDTVTLIWSEGNAPVAMNGAVFGKTVTITGTATVDWSMGFLFVGRGGVGNGKVIFDEANLTSASNNASTGIHVSGREKNTDNKYDGTVEIKNSTIVLDYLINKGTMTLDNSTLTVKNGFSVGGRPASETESGQDATATIALTNGSKVVVNNHNGMGLGYEAIGVMDVDATSTFETTQSFLVTAKGTMNIAGKAIVAGTLTNNGVINLTAEGATLKAQEGLTVNSTVEGRDVSYADGVYSTKLGLKGKGTEAEPFLIGNIEELMAFRNSVNGGETKYSAPGVYVALAADIDMAGENWVGIGSMNAEHGFMGNFDGKGYKIKNLTITDPTLGSDGYAYAGLFGVTEGTDQNNQNTIKNLTIENVTITTTGHIAAAAVAYPYYTIIDNVKVCGDIKILGGNYTAGVLAYTRRCVNASNLSIVGNDGSFVKGNQTVGGVISDIQMNGGLTAVYNNFSAEGLTISGEKSVGGISGIIATQTLDGASVKNVTLSCSDARVGIVSGCLGGTSTISNVTYENVTGATNLIGATYDNAKAVAAKIGDTYYATLEDALAAVLDGETITLTEGAEGDESKTEIEFTKAIEFTLTGKAPKYALPVITFQNATVNIKDAEVLIPELDARQNATINVIDSKVVGVGGDDIIKSYYNGAINIEGKSEVYTMQVTTMGYINIKGEAKLNATWQTNVYGNGMITMAEGATFNTAALQLTGKDYSGRDNTDAERVGMPATIVVDGANFTVGKVTSNNGADYSYNSSKGINIGTIDGKNAVLDIKNGANVNFFMANGQTANIGAGGTVNIDGALSVACRGEGNVTLVNNGAINLTSEGATLKAQEGLKNIATTLPGYFVKYVDGVYTVCGEIAFVDGEFTEYTNAADMVIKTLTYKRNVLKTWVPIYVPFEIPVSMLAEKFYVARINDVRRTDNNNDGELDDFDMEIIFIHGGNADGSSKTLKANYPYFIKSKSGKTETMEITLTDATLYAAKENVFDCTTMTEKFEIKGNCRLMQANEFDPKNQYTVLTTGEWGHTTSALKPFRFYMTKSSRYEDEPAAPMNSMRITVRGEEDENGATIIYDVVEDSLNNNGNDFIYDLQGRRVSEPKKGGIYIKNGKKILY
ncbi:MAG: hypothetical protein UH685_00660 [Bacteroidaceae bacterium]|nr:hypothetical protein [Bacteroidaceae bacterium]